MAKRNKKASHFATNGTFSDIVASKSDGSAKPKHQAARGEAPVGLSSTADEAEELEEPSAELAAQDLGADATALDETTAAESSAIEATNLDAALEPASDAPIAIVTSDEAEEVLAGESELASSESDAAPTVLDDNIDVIQGEDLEPLPVPVEATLVEQAVDVPADPAPLAGLGDEAPVIAAPQGDVEPLVVLTGEEEEERKRKGGFKRFAIGLLAVVGVVGAAYAGGALYFTQNFMPNTTIDGEDVSLKSVQAVAESHASETSQYQLSVSGQNFTLTVPASSVDLSSDGTAYAEAAMSQIDPWKWPLEIIEDHKLTVDGVASYDKAKLEKVVGDAVGAFNAEAKQPVDAKLEVDEATKLYKITPEQGGTAIDQAKVMELVGQALGGLQKEVKLDESALLKPAVYADDARLNEAMKKANACLGAVQTLRVDDKDVYTMGTDVISRFVSLGSDLQVAVDFGAITEWAQGELSAELDTVGAERTYTRPDGKQITVSGGVYGWSIDGASVAETISKNIEAGTAASIDVPMLSEGARWNPGGQDWSDRYIDIDISEQYVRMYDGGNIIWESPCVTGRVADHHETPTGVYYVNDNKESGNIRLEGEDDPVTGQPEYVSYVTYWMPFIWNAIAMHDATWRYEFGGSVYVNDGSHGCVNLPSDKAEQLFGICEVGDVVITHY